MHRHSIGQGKLAYVVWIGFFPPEQKAQDGIYVSFCFGKTGNGLVTGCAVSNTSQKKYSFIPTVKRNNPVIDVDGKRRGTHYNNTFVNPLEVWAGNVEEEKLFCHIKDSVEKCLEWLNKPKPETIETKSRAEESLSNNSFDQLALKDNGVDISSGDSCKSNKLFDQSALSAFQEAVKSSGLQYDDVLEKRFIAALCAKPFVILTGLSGSGKTKLAQAFTEWMSVPELENVKLIPVGADWTNNEHLMGYPNALDEKQYVMPDTGVLKFMLEAGTHEDIPYFLIMDEMNLSHVERYFADFLSAMESGDKIRLYGGINRRGDDGSDVPDSMPFPKNLYVIGTMNVDETTYMFSPKVLDRAQVIEFRVSKDEMAKYLVGPKEINIKAIKGKGTEYAKSFLEKRNSFPPLEKQEDETVLKEALLEFFAPLSDLGAEFGYRTAFEIKKFVAYYCEMGATIEKAIDAAIIQKLLPKLHGSQARLGPVLDKLSELSKDKYPLSLNKIERMQKRLEVGFTSFAEA